MTQTSLIQNPIYIFVVPKSDFWTSMKLRITSLDNKRFSITFLIDHKVLDETHDSTCITFKIKDPIMNLRILNLFYKICCLFRSAQNELFFENQNSQNQGKYRWRNSSTVVFSCWANFAWLSAGTTNRPKRYVQPYNFLDLF